MSGRKFQCPFSAEEEAPEAAVVVTTEAAAEAPVTGGAVGGAEPAKEAPAVAAGEVTGKAGGADIEVSFRVIWFPSDRF